MSILSSIPTRSSSLPPPGPIDSPSAQIWISPDGSSVERPPLLRSEIYVLLCSFVWFPVMAIMTVIFLILCFPILSMHAVYVHLVIEIDRTRPSFIALGPVILLLCIYTIFTFVVAQMIGIPWGLFILGFETVHQNFQELEPFLFTTNQCMSWLDLISAGIAAGVHAESSWSLLYRIPLALVWNPYFKYFCTTNPWLYDLRIRYVTEWSAPIEFDARKPALRMSSICTSNVERSSSFTSSIFTSKSSSIDSKKITPALDEQQQKVIAASYPLPPSWRQVSIVAYRNGLKLPSAPGLEYGTFLPQFTVTGHTGDIWEDTENAALSLSNSGERLASASTLSYLNPFHILTGYSEVNVRASCAVEHPLWACVGSGRMAHYMLACYSRFILLPSRVNKRPVSNGGGAFVPSSIAVFEPVLPAVAEASQRESASLDSLYYQEEADQKHDTEDDIDYDLLAKIEDRRQQRAPIAEEKEQDTYRIASSKLSDEFDARDYDEVISDTDQSIDDNLVAVVVDPVQEIEYTEEFHSRKIGFSIALSMDKRRATSHVIVDEVYGSCPSSKIRVGDEIILLEHVEVLRESTADEERQLVNFLALVTRIRQGPRPIRMVFSRPPPITEEPRARRVQLPRRPISVQQRPLSRPLSINRPDANQQWL